MDTSGKMSAIMDLLKCLGFILVISVLSAIGVNCLFYLCDRIVIDWKESNRIDTDIRKTCVGSLEAPGMMTDKQWTEDGSILVMCDNGKERWIKVVR